MPRLFHSARLKIKRANSHIDTLIGDSSPLPKHLYEITNGPGRSNALLTKPDGFYLTYTPKEPIADYFGPIIGDAVNNLREAVDYCANAAIQAAGRAGKFYFPFSMEWKDLETSPNYPPIKKAFPDFADFIRNDIKPCRDTNLHLWAATSLCNFNKHNDFIPTVSLVTVDNINARIGTNTLKDCSIGGDADRPIRMIRSAIPIAMDQNFSTAVEITFPKGAVFKNEPVIPTLTQMSQVVAQTLDAVERFVRPYVK